MHRTTKKFIDLLRKSLALIVVAVYILFSVGILKATHFCMGREASVEFFSAESKQCPCSLYAKEKTDCCDDEHELIKIDDEQKVIATLSAPVPVWKIERFFADQLVASARLHDPLVLGSLRQESPPKIPLWKVHQHYVFYSDDSDSSVIA